MPMGTLELPRSMIDAAYSYADKESLSVADFFAKLLHAQYGYVVTMAVDVPAKQSPSRKAISPRVRALRGVAKIADNRPYKDILSDAITERYESLS